MIYIKGITSLKLEKDLCTGCGMCTIVCPHAVFKIEDKKAVILNADVCMECGACAKNCPANALFVKAGVGCAYAIFSGMVSGGKPSCGCSCS
jgi:NAD-dependent dihydropyrimidine dehydrogenase PreA subunit